jgi:hypothetical protein
MVLQVQIVAVLIMSATVFLRVILLFLGKSGDTYIHVCIGSMSMHSLNIRKNAGRE